MKKNSRGFTEPVLFKFTGLIYFLLIFIFLKYFLFNVSASYAQNSGAYLIPRVVYVGDPATLVLPLPGAAKDTDDIILTGRFLPSDAGMDFHRIVLERRMSGNRLLIEFTAFMPGLLELPVIEIDNMAFNGLTVKISSVVDGRSTLELSRPASSLAMPGTALMLYGTITSFALLFLLFIWFTAKGRRYMQRWIDKWKRWRSFVSIRKTEKNLYKAMLRGGNKREILDNLSGEFRNFLSFITGINCRAMTSREFMYNFEKIVGFDPFFLMNFFRQCDEMRFSGGKIGSEDILRLLDDMRQFLVTIEKVKLPANGLPGGPPHWHEKEKQEEKPAA